MRGRGSGGLAVAETGRAADGFAAAEGCAVGAGVFLLRAGDGEEGEQEEGEVGGAEGEVHFLLLLFEVCSFFRDLLLLVVGLFEGGNVEDGELAS